MHLMCTSFACLFGIMLYVPVMPGKVLLGCTSSKQQVHCLAQGNITVVPPAVSPSFLWRFSGFSLFWYLLLWQISKYGKPLKHQRRLGLTGSESKQADSWFQLNALTTEPLCSAHHICIKMIVKPCNSYTMGCPPVRGDNPRALASGLSYVQVDKHGITILYHLHQCRPCTSQDISC